MEKERPTQKKRIQEQQGFSVSPIRPQLANATAWEGRTGAALIKANKARWYVTQVEHLEEKKRSGCQTDG